MPKAKILEFSRGSITSVISKKKETKEFVLKGEAKCLQCNNYWKGIFPLGSTDLLCPKCKTNRGIFVNNIEPRSKEIFECECGNSLFYLLDTGDNQCPNCGGILEIDQ